MHILGEHLKTEARPTTYHIVYNIMSPAVYAAHHSREAPVGRPVGLLAGPRRDAVVRVIKQEWRLARLHAVLGQE